MIRQTWKLFLIYLGTGAIMVTGRPLHYQKNIIKLMDKTFEHQTQASTGQTTGSWLIWFHKRGDETLIDGDRPEDDFFQEKNIVLGSVNADLLSSETIERFSITDFPSFIYLHRGKLYRYPHSANYAWTDLSHFCLEGYKVTEGESVPPPPSEFAKMIATLAGPAGLPLRIGLVFVVAIFILYTSFMSTIHQPKEKDD